MVQFSFKHPYIRNGLLFLIGIAHEKNIEKVSENEARVTLYVRIQSIEEPSPFIIEAVVEAKFRWTESVMAILPNLLNQNAPSLLVGYLRPVIAMFTNSSGMTPYNLPMLDFTDEPIEQI